MNSNVRERRIISQEVNWLAESAMCSQSDVTSALHEEL